MSTQAGPEPAQVVTPPLRQPKRALALALFMAPVAYCGVILGVAVHEVVGHGCVALLLGGEFHGFTLMWDGMGYALVSVAEDAPSWHRVVVLLGGLVATVFAGTVLVGAALWVQSSILRITLLVLGAATLLDSAAYTFWSALYPGTIGDAARIVALLDSSIAQWLLVLLGGILTIVCTILPAALMLPIVESCLSSEPSPRRIRWVVVGVFFFLPFAGSYYLFDWNQLVAGVGMWPAHVNVALCLVASVILRRNWLSQSTTITPQVNLLVPCAVAWGLAIGLYGITAFWLGNGVYW